MSLIFVLNPVAGKGKARELKPIIEKICKDNNIEFQIRETSLPGDGKTIALQAVKEGYKKIISVGGDGTLNEVLNGIIGSDASLGVIPGGSGNDFIRSINQSRDIERIILDIINGEERYVDIGLCNNKYFINVGSAGFDAEAVIKTEKAKKFFSGSTAYIAAVLHTILKYRGWDMEVEIDDKKFKSRTLLTAIANGGYYGGGMMPAPEARIDDGYFDVCHVGHMSKLKMLVLFPKYMKGKHGSIKGVSFYRGKRVRITCSEPVAVNLDGEIIKDREIEFKLIQNGIKVIFPKKAAQEGQIINLNIPNASLPQSLKMPAASQIKF